MGRAHGGVTVFIGIVREDVDVGFIPAASSPIIIVSTVSVGMTNYIKKEKGGLIHHVIPRIRILNF